MIALLPNGTFIILVFEREEIFLVRWWDFVSNAADLDHWKDQIIPMETDIILEPIGQTFIDGNFEKIVQNIHRKKERPKYHVKVLDERLECRPLSQKTNMFAHGDPEAKSKPIWYNELQAISVQSSEETSYRLSFVRLNDELIFRSERRPKFLSHVVTNLHPGHGTHCDTVEFMTYAAVQIDEKGITSIPDALVVIRDRVIHIYSTKDDDIQSHDVDIRYELIF